MTFPPPQPGGTFTNLLEVEGERNKKLESRDTKPVHTNVSPACQSQKNKFWAKARASVK